MASYEAENLCRGISVLHDEAVELAENILFMKDKLEETRRAIENQPIVMPYDNGGGQKGIRRNPAYESYQKLLITYNKSLSQLSDMIAKGKANPQAESTLSRLKILAGNKSA